MEPIRLNEAFYRKGSQISAPIVVNFAFGNGGLGDFIAYTQALVFIAEQHPQVQGAVWAHGMVLNFIKHILKPYPRFFVRDIREFKGKHYNKRPTLAPQNHPVSPVGSHQLDLGFVYFCNLNPAPHGYRHYPKARLDELKRRQLPEKYIVLTPLYTTDIRMWPIKAFNGVKRWCLDQGYGVVLLGKQEMSGANYKGQMRPEYDFEGCINLIDQTDILEALKIIGDARAIVGLDNGLMHLAACTETPIVVGYNVTSPEHRYPIRLKGETQVVLPSSQLTCRFCQSQMRFFFKENFFKSCLYKDYKCLGDEELGDPLRWVIPLQQVLMKASTNET